MRKIICFLLTLLSLTFSAKAVDLGLAMPAHTNSYLTLSQEGGTMMYGSGHALPGIPGMNAYYYLSGEDLGRNETYSGTIIDGENLVTLGHVYNNIEDSDTFGIKFITSGTNEQTWTLGDDMFGQDWSFDNNTFIEQRIYTPGDPATVEVALFYGQQKIIVFDDSNVYMILNYLTQQIQGYTDAVGYTKVEGLQDDASDIADAFIADFDRAGGQAILLFDSIDPIIHEDGTAIINGSPAPLYYAIYSWQGRIQTALDGPVCDGVVAGDINFDCCVNIEDLVIMAQNWGQCNWQ